MQLKLEKNPFVLYMFILIVFELTFQVLGIASSIGYSTR
jgi:hypothetical protein